MDMLHLTVQPEQTCLCSHLLQAQGLGVRIKALIPGNNPIRKEALIGVQYVSDAGCVGLGTHGEHMQLKELGDLLQELSSVRSETTVVKELVVWQMEPVHIL